MVGLTRIPHGLVQVDGLQAESAVRVKEGTLKTAVPEEPDVSEVEHGFYDPHQGVLTLNMFNGQRIQIAGFPTQNNAPVGPTGPDGLPGKDGQDGRDGRDGKPGKPGCEGPEGPTGKPGRAGSDGRMGQIGQPGVRGCPGPAGPTGVQGPTGPAGPVGPTGPTGDPGPKGAPGAAGPPGRANIVVSATDPGAVGGGWLWVNPSATGAGSAPALTDPPLGSVVWP